MEDSVLVVMAYLKLLLLLLVEPLSSEPLIVEPPLSFEPLIVEPFLYFLPCSEKNGNELVKGGAPKCVYKVQWEGKGCELTELQF